jgi:hypothetical protein
MARLNNTAMTHARATLRRWIGESPEGAYFLPGNGKAIPLRPDERLAICASAEQYIIERHRAFERSLFTALTALVGGSFLIFLFKKSLFPGEFWTIYAYVEIFATLAVMLHAAWHYERALLTLRKAIGHALRQRIPMSTGFDDKVVRAEPDYEKWGPIIIYGSGILFAFPFLVQIVGAIMP